MKITKPDYFSKFKCIASDCEDTCCAGWGIAIDNETHKKYLAVGGAFGDRLKNEIISDDEENIFRLKGDNCTFLNEDKLCDIYTQLGCDALCHTCREYPRYSEEFGELREIGISLSCPEAARIIIGLSEKVELESIENNESRNTISDIEDNNIFSNEENFESLSDEADIDSYINDDEFDVFSETDEIIFENLMACRKIIFEILQNRNLDLRVRSALVLIFASEIQEKIDGNEIEHIKLVEEKFLDQDFINETITIIEEYKGKESEKYNNINEIFKVFQDLKHIKPNDPLGLEDALRYFWQSEDDEMLYLDIHRKFEVYYKEKEYHFEQILVYFIYKHFMKSVFDYDVLAKVKTALVSCLMIKELAVVRYLENREFTKVNMVDIAHTYSKDVEHLEENLETLAEVFETNEAFIVEKLLETIMN